jgi:hypothetical protein
MCESRQIISISIQLRYQFRDDAAVWMASSFTTSINPPTVGKVKCVLREKIIIKKASRGEPSWT